MFTEYTKLTQAPMVNTSSHRNVHKINRSTGTLKIRRVEVPELWVLQLCLPKYLHMKNFYKWGTYCTDFLSVYKTFLTDSLI